MGVVIDLHTTATRAAPMFTFVERQLADKMIDLSGDLRAITLQLLALDRLRSRWPMENSEQATLATRLIELGQQLRTHASEGHDNA